MNKRTIGRLLCLLMLVGVLVLTSCGTATPTTSAPATTATTMARPATTTAVSPVTTAPTGKPQYGGMLTLSFGSDIIDFDEVTGFAQASPTTTLHITNEELWMGDWAKGKAGTGQTDWALYGLDRWEYKIGSVAESWDISNPKSLVYRIRKGIRWGLNPNSEASRLVNGRELTADDVVFSLTQQITNPKAYLFTTVPELKTAEISAADKYTVVIKLQDPRAQYSSAVLRFGDFVSIVPKEVYDKYGTMQNWRYVVGTGPYMLNDFVSGSSATFIRNANYWDKDPVGPGKGNQLPYPDGVKILIITDASTRLAGLRTGKIDHTGAGWEDVATMKKEQPSIQSNDGNPSYSDTGQNTMLNTKNAPLNDLKVRRALLMSIDFKTVAAQLWGPAAAILNWPLVYNDQYKNAYLSLDEAPASIKELYSYNPAKAKQLLSEAGYPNGFKTNVICSNAAASVDYYSVLKDYWAKIGVELTVNAREYAVWQSIQRGRSYDQMAENTYMGLAGIYLCRNFMGSGWTNGSMIDDPYVTEAFNKMQDAILAGGQQAADPIHKELMKYVLDQAWAVPTPKSPIYYLWWPWLKNYHGEQSVGYASHYNWTKYVWLDQELKRSMGR